MKRYTITRWCCLSRMCVDCKTKGGRTRVVQLETDSETMAKMCVNGWHQYDAKLIDHQATGTSEEPDPSQT